MMRLREIVDLTTGELYTCEHGGWHCSKVYHPEPYMITRSTPDGPEFIRWSTPDDLMFPCLCDCASCVDWRLTMEEIDGPIVLPVE